MLKSWTLSSSALAFATVLGAVSCGGSSGGGTGFAVESISVPEGAVWQINRPIQVRFTRPVAFSSISFNTINIRKVGGANTVGEFFLQDPQTVVFQPLCPTEADFSDAALAPGGVEYELTIVGSSSNPGFTVKSTDGAVLGQTVQRRFQTPSSLEPTVLFFDPVVGPPQPRIRGRDGVGLNETNATYVELGGDSSLAARLYFVDTGAGIELQDDSGQSMPLPLNLFSQQATQVVVMLFVNQPVSPTLPETALRFEYEASANNWVEIPSRADLIANCTSTGALLRIEPLGVLAPAAPTRLVISTTFADLVSETNQAPLTDFALVMSDVGPIEGNLKDEIFEPFDEGGEEDPEGSLEDVTAALPEPPASWGGGRLAPGFDFEGTGGPLGTFDVRVPAGQELIWSTTSQLLTGGPNFAPTQQTQALGGVFNFDDFLIEEGATVRFEGPNPVLILATGTVDIQGRILVNGSSNRGVVVLQTANVPEEGASGQCGGGRGGAGSPLTNAHSVRGGRGAGPGDLPDFGGIGGETGWSSNNGANQVHLRGAGGGGGVFGSNQLLGMNFDERFIGLNAEPGFDGANTFDDMGEVVGAFGAENPENKESPPDGGGVGNSPFIDGDPTNDFFGRFVDPMTGQVVIGELSDTWAGSGGGGGGDGVAVDNANQIFPPAFGPGRADKGGGAGGGGGAVTILAIGPIIFGPNGQLQCRGGHGGGGENTNFVNRIGGGGGGGSGGHVIVQSATAIDFSSKTAGANGVPAILATGGQGGAGSQPGCTAAACADKGGATLLGETTAALDACPPPAIGCAGVHVGAGGDGGPGLVQLHTPEGDISAGGDIVTPPSGLGVANYCFPAPVPPLLPRFGRNSRSRSVWVQLGEGGFDPASPATPIPPTFSFEGTDPLTGSILVDGQMVQDLPPIAPVAALQDASTGPPFIAADGFTLVISGAGIEPELKGNPILMRGYLIDLITGFATTRFSVFDADYDASLDRFALVVSMSGAPLSSAGSPGTDVAVRPAFFRVVGEQGVDVIPPNVDIQIFFEAAPEDPSTGLPDESDSSGLQSDITLLNQLSPGGQQYRFVRFEVAFDVDKNETGISVDQTGAALDFLRLPFEY